MDKLIKKIHNVETGEVIERNFTSEEIAQRVIDEENYNLAQAEIESKAIARQAILDRLGLTAEEAALLIS